MTADKLRAVLSDVGEFSNVFMPGRVLRSYQADPARVIVQAVIDRRAGRETAGEFGVVFSRQAGKDEMLAQICAYLLLIFSKVGGQVVVALPTMRPQGQIAVDRLAARVRNSRSVRSAKPGSETARSCSWARPRCISCRRVRNRRLAVRRRRSFWSPTSVRTSNRTVGTRSSRRWGPRPTPSRSTWERSGRHRRFLRAR